MKSTITLYQWAGDRQTFEKLFELFYDKVLNDDLLSETFKNMSSESKIRHFPSTLADFTRQISVPIL